MTTLKAEKRDLGVKAKKMRRDGFVTGVLMGRDLKESIPLKFPEQEATRFIKECKEGHQVILDLEGKKISAIVKSIDYDPIRKQILTLDFQALVSDEKISAIAQIRLLNEEAVKGYVLQELTEIHYKAYPADLVETIDIDFAALGDVKAIHVGDLAISQNEKINVVTPADMLILHVTDHLNHAAETEETATEATAE